MQEGALLAGLRYDCWHQLMVPARGYLRSCEASRLASCALCMVYLCHWGCLMVLLLPAGHCMPSWRG